MTISWLLKDHLLPARNPALFAPRTPCVVIAHTKHTTMEAFFCQFMGVYAGNFDMGKTLVALNVCIPLLNPSKRNCTEHQDKHKDNVCVLVSATLDS